MKLTKDRLCNDFRETMREIVDVKNGRLRPDGGQLQSSDHLLLDGGLSPLQNENQLNRSNNHISKMRIKKRNIAAQS